MDVVGVAPHLSKRARERISIEQKKEHISITFQQRFSNSMMMWLLLHWRRNTSVALCWRNTPREKEISTYLLVCRTRFHLFISQMWKLTESASRSCTHSHAHVYHTISRLISSCYAYILLPLTRSLVFFLYFFRCLSLHHLQQTPFQALNFAHTLFATTSFHL